MTINRRRLIATIGAAISSAALPKYSAGDAAHDCKSTTGYVPKECQPNADSWRLAYVDPSTLTVDIARTGIAVNFKAGLEWGFAPKHVRGVQIWMDRAASEYEPISKPGFKAALDRSYGDTFDKMVPVFPSDKPLWITVNDHAFILGQLAVTLRKDPDLTKPLKHRDYLRAQARLMHAVASSLCACFSGGKDAFAVPSLPDKNVSGNGWVAQLPTPTAIPQPTRGASSPTTSPIPGEIDQDCVLCG